VRPSLYGAAAFFQRPAGARSLGKRSAHAIFQVLMSDTILMMGDTPGRNDDGIDDDGLDTGVVTRTKPRTKKPSNYKVLMLNDDYTPMEFVVLVLQRYFSMDIEDATRVMLQVHQQGVAVCGVFTYEVAETKVSQVIDFARENQHPLQCTLEKA
jgi:ATP-dependent Clp protease adaptor protein ClpS